MTHIAICTQHIRYYYYTVILWNGVPTHEMVDLELLPNTQKMTMMQIPSTRQKASTTNFCVIFNSTLEK